MAPPSPATAATTAGTKVRGVGRRAAGAVMVTGEAVTIFRAAWSSASQLALENLSGGGHRQRRHEFDHARIFVCRHGLLAPRNDFGFGDFRTLSEDDKCLDLFAVPLVGHADNGGKRNRRVGH